MDLFQALKALIALATLATGIVAMIRPHALRGFTGLAPDGERGVTEIRAVLGGAFIGLGAAPLLLNNEAAYHMLGIMYLMIAVIRAVSIFVDKSGSRSNWFSLALEILFGAVLMIL